MSNIIKEKLDKLINNPIRKLYQNMNYKQDSIERNAQISFYKLLMILAYSDDSIDESELEVIKNHLYNDCITEAEWKEIDFYKIHKPSQEEIKQILESAMLKINSLKDREEFQKALVDIVNADSILKTEEKEILSFISNEMSTVNVIKFKNIFKKIAVNITKESNSLSKDFVKNPVYPLIKTVLQNEKEETLSTLSAKLGLALIVIYSDMNFDEKEKILFKEMVKIETKLDDTTLNELLLKIYKIPEDNFEITYLCRVLTDNLSEEDRILVLKDLFKIARADNIYDPYEDKYLRIIAGFLFISDTIFFKLKRDEI